MRDAAYDLEAKRLSDRLPPLPRIAVLGSTRFWHSKSPAVCNELGVALASLGHVLLVTGGLKGAAEAIGRSFDGARGGRGLVVHILPIGHEVPNFGSIHFAGSSLAHRRELLGRLASVYIVVEGGPGTADEVAIARSEGSCIIPVACLGGVGATVHAQCADAPRGLAKGDWALLSADDATPLQLAQAVARMSSSLLVLSSGTAVGR